MICNQEFEVSKRSTQTLCSVNCQKEWQKLQIGEKNPRYTRQKAICEYCGKEIVVKKYKTENGQHLFCSTQCRRNWYSRVWSQQDDWKEESRIRAAKILESGAIGTDTKPQRIINEMLDEMTIKYVNEKSYKYFSVDNYLIEHNLIIEVMGDFWHCNPLKYIDNFHIIQKKRIPKDKAKHTYMRNNHNIEILYLWEDDIYNHPYLCRRLIREYIKSGGKLQNYHSFNYHIKNNKLLLNGSIILPYQDR